MHLGATYTVSGGGVQPSTPLSYQGDPVFGFSFNRFTLPLGSAGQGDVTITITDVSGGACTVVETVTDPGACSTFVFTGNNTGGNAFMAFDPCSCNGDQVLNADGTVAMTGTFSETVTVNGPPNLNVRIRTISASSGSDPNSVSYTHLTLPTKA